MTSIWDGAHACRIACKARQNEDPELRITTPTALLDQPRNGFKNKQYKPKPKPGHKKSGGKKSCVWCKEDAHPRDKCPAKDATCNFCGKQGHFERARLKKKGLDKDKKFKHQFAVDIEPEDQEDDSSEYEYDFNLNVISINIIDSRKSREVEWKSLLPLIQQ
ncbi:hypothetical protein ACROYT_G005375 [Oculina patagonica]